jgi:hypothetical protein
LSLSCAGKADSKYISSWSRLPFLPFCPAYYHQKPHQSALLPGLAIYLTIQ